MSPSEKTEFRAALREAFCNAIDDVGIDAFKRTSLFGSNDVAFQSRRSIESLKKAA